MVFGACGGDQREVVPLIPDVFVDIRISLADARARALLIDGGYVRLSGGVEGIILFRQNAQHYLAFERKCTYQTDSCGGRVDVDSSGLFMHERCCGSQFGLLTGEPGSPIGGPAFLPLKRYQVIQTDNALRIVN